MQNTAINNTKELLPLSDKMSVRALGQSDYKDDAQVGTIHDGKPRHDDLQQ
jgi:hypothetical protein